MVDEKFENRPSSQALVDRYFTSKAAKYGQNRLNLFWTITRFLGSKKVFKLAGDLDGKKCLDVGCGTGFYSKLMIENGAAHVSCVDRNSAMLAQINHPQIVKIEASAEDFVTPTTYDFVLLAGVLEFLENPEVALENSFSHAKRGARLVALIPNTRILGELYGFFHRTHGFNVNLFTAPSFKRMLAETGWSLEVSEYAPPFSLVVSARRND